MKKFKLLSLKNLVPQSKVTKQRKPATRLAARLTQPAYDDYEEEHDEDEEHDDDEDAEVDNDADAEDEDVDENAGGS